MQLKNPLYYTEMTRKRMWMCHFKSFSRTKVKFAIFVCLVGFFTFKLTAMVMSWWSVHLTLFFWASLTKRLTSILWLTTVLLESAEGIRMAVEIISWSISEKVWDQAGIKLATPGSAVRHVSAVRQFTDCSVRPSKVCNINLWVYHNSFLTSFDFCCLLITSANSLD